MLCPACKENSNKVIDSRLTEGGAAIRRRRICLACGRRFTTKERVERELRLTVVKTDGRRVPYNRDNILNGAQHACCKLDISSGQLEELVDCVEENLFRKHDREVSTEQIGAYVSRHLRSLNPVAYVRFMSVYRKYGTVDEFIEEISEVREHAAHENPAQQSLFES